MANVIKCPKCDRQLRVPDELLGQSVKCPSCNETFTAALAAPPEPPPSSVPSEPPPRSREDDEVEERPSRRRPRRDDEDDDYEERGRSSRRRNLAPHRGDMIQIMGILSFFFMPPVLGTIAWVMGNADLKEMDAGRMDPSGRKATETGRLCGKIALIIWGSLIGFIMLAWMSCCCLGVVGGGGGGRY